MREDKATLLLEGIPMWQRQINVLREAGAVDLLIAGPRDGAWAGGGWRTVPDATATAGPISGLAAGLQHSGHTFTACLAVDMPGMSANYLRALTAEASCSNNSVVPRVKTRWEPLAAVYHQSMLPLTLAFLAGGSQSLQQLMDFALQRGQIIPKQVEEDEELLFWNANTPEEWDAFVNRRQTCAQKCYPPRQEIKSPPS